MDQSKYMKLINLEDYKDFLVKPMDDTNLSLPEEEQYYLVSEEVKDVVYNDMIDYVMMAARSKSGDMIDDFKDNMTRISDKKEYLSQNFTELKVRNVFNPTSCQVF